VQSLPVLDPSLSRTLSRCSMAPIDNIKASCLCGSVVVQTMVRRALNIALLYCCCLVLPKRAPTCVCQADSFPNVDEFVCWMHWLMY
jgi:hypothetical protein